MTINQFLKNNYSICLFLFIFLFAACSDDDGGSDGVQQATVKWKGNPTVSTEKGSATLLLEGTPGLTWKAEIAEGVDWCAFEYNFSGDASAVAKTGTLKEGVNALYIYFRANNKPSQRTAKIHLTFAGGEPQVLQLTQVAAGEVVKPVLGKWPELPEQKQNANYEYATHYAKLANGQKVRNFSLCYDKTKKNALWVAYPLHKAYIGGVGRTEAWEYDPYVDEKYQPRLFKGFKTSGYDRGHQIPSGDRTGSVSLNEQTFYFSNMTPQLDRLNQDMWAKLEIKVRDDFNCSDTLYVVTGAHFANTNKTAKDNSGVQIPVPTHYFKVFLRTKNGRTGKKIYECKPSELISVGVWVEHKSYGNVEPPKSVFMSVSEIEQKTGHTFFPNVDASVKQSFNPSDWNI